MLTEKTFDAGTVVINYAEGSANGEPFVLLHGITDRWQGLTGLITSLENHWHVFACDQRGHGKSGRATSYHGPDYFPDTIAFIRNQVGSPTVLLGHSGGTITALGTAGAIPELVRAVILLDPPLCSRELSIFKSTAAYTNLTEVYSVATRRLTAREFCIKAFPGIDEGGIQWFEEMLAGVDPEVIKASLDDNYLDGLKWEELLAKVACPILMLYGEFERGGLVRENDVGFFLANTQKGTATLIKDSGHVIHTEQPARVLELMTHWLGML